MSTVRNVVVNLVEVQRTSMFVCTIIYNIMFVDDEREEKEEESYKNKKQIGSKRRIYLNETRKM